MHAPSPSLASRLSLGRLAALLVTGCVLAACDRHSAEELPKSYGHGSSHEKSYRNHQIDSRKNSQSFSDTQGQENSGEGEKATPVPSASPAATQSDRFFPSGS